MKKILFSVIMLLGIYTTSTIQAAAPVTIGAIVAAVKAAVSLYEATPNAEYTVTIVDGQGRGATYSVSSATAAIKAAIVALENGARSVNLDSVYPTVHPSCRNRTYYKSDLNYLRSR
ncbi:MAG: hypothetical protein E7148_07530 [Rikenellaceae bacterium]|nr:hypothetical protein [Rikenellaceae bacterium]